jgi:hypothetical protein
MLKGVSCISKSFFQFKLDLTNKKNMVHISRKNTLNLLGRDVLFRTEVYHAGIAGVNSIFRYVPLEARRVWTDGHDNGNGRQVADGGTTPLNQEQGTDPPRFPRKYSSAHTAGHQSRHNPPIIASLTYLNEMKQPPHT